MKGLLALKRDSGGWEMRSALYLFIHGFLHIHVLMNCVHQYTVIYEGIGLLALKGYW